MPLAKALRRQDDPMQRARLVNADTVGWLVQSLRDHGAQRILELGCSEGNMTALLVEAGFTLTGCDPSDRALARARARLPDTRFLRAKAEALPADLPRFDAACFINALHHVDPHAMGDALRGALAVLRPGGLLYVIEPLNSGSFFRAMRPIEDESPQRDAAMRAVEALISSRQAELRDLNRWSRESRFDDLQDFVEYLARIDPDRSAAAVAQAPALARAWRENIMVRDGQALLVQPLICWTLAPLAPLAHDGSQP